VSDPRGDGVDWWLFPFFTYFPRFLFNLIPRVFSAITVFCLFPSANRPSLASSSNLPQTPASCALMFFAVPLSRLSLAFVYPISSPPPPFSLLFFVFLIFISPRMLTYVFFAFLPLIFLSTVSCFPGVHFAVCVVLLFVYLKILQILVPT
jgi:hypothetical protein